MITSIRVLTRRLKKVLTRKPLKLYNKRMATKLDRYGYDQVVSVVQAVNRFSDTQRKELWRMLKENNTCLDCGCRMTDWGCSDDCDDDRIHFGASGDRVGGSDHVTLPGRLRTPLPGGTP